MSHLPVQQWRDNLASASVRIRECALQLIDQHRTVSPRAEEICGIWRLVQRRDEESAVLEILKDAVGGVLQAIDSAMSAQDEAGFQAAAEAIELRLPAIESSVLDLRRNAQDLLHWVGRYAWLDDSEWPTNYREAYGDLIAFAPEVRPRLEDFQQHLLRQSGDPQLEADGARALLAALSRYLGVSDSARAFVQSVIEPPMELVFEETDDFINGLVQIPSEKRRLLASLLNDSCQSLLYEPEIFERHARPVPFDASGGVDSSLVVFAQFGYAILMTVDEDPIFGQLTLRLLNVVAENELKVAQQRAIRLLQQEWE